ncbi:hypothetical protein D3C81_1748750 [compost metagenome]
MSRLDRYSRRRWWSTDFWLKYQFIGWIRKREWGEVMRRPAARNMMMPMDSMLPALIAQSGTGNDLRKV